MSRKPTPEETFWCLGQTIAIVKDAGRGGTSMRQASGASGKASIRYSVRGAETRFEGAS